jgi:hypothetical protein
MLLLEVDVSCSFAGDFGNIIERICSGLWKMLSLKDIRIGFRVADQHVRVHRKIDVAEAQGRQID